MEGTVKADSEKPDAETRNRAFTIFWKEYSDYCFAHTGFRAPPKFAGKLWKNMTVDEKAHYYAKAEHNDIEADYMELDEADESGKTRITPFLVFWGEYEKMYEWETPEKNAAWKWKAMSDAERAPYVAKAAKTKAEYNKDMKAYNMKLARGVNKTGDDESGKSDSIDEEMSESADETDEQMPKAEPVEL